MNPLGKYETRLLRDLHCLAAEASNLPELRYVLNNAWHMRVRNVIETWGAERSFKDAGYNLYRILTDDRLPLTVGSLAAEKLEGRLQTIAKVASSQQKLRDYR